MSQFHLAENLTRLRHEKGITQEKLADFLGVSKASVSKWETGQSLPDIAQLPRLAAFYDITIDALMGYEPKLTMAEVKEYYEKFAESIVVNGFEETLVQIRDFIRMYYSCDIALLQMVVLLMNHFMMAGEEKIPALLEEMIELCKHVQIQSEDVDVCNVATIYQANLELLRGNAGGVIEMLEKRKNPMHLTEGTDTLLIQAYQMAGRMEEADEWNQVSMYNDLLRLVQGSVQYLMNHMQDKERAEASIIRIDAIMDAYDLKQLHTNAYLQFVYARAMFYTLWETPELALEQLKEFVTVAIDFMTNNPSLHGDVYFDKLDGYFEKVEEYIVLPRNPKTVLSSLAENISAPVFAPLFENSEYQKLLEKVK